ncbi:uncharacterized protein [Aegilops tauschii subsp. strangulata]|uniref:uncharacterized protein isoform X2 n=1 Tax=Aegilops tauschii subsp. strangulata TaxID=200361 RepID=UPI001E1CA966|nr:uncharacterized protein LOC120976409 isoform X2 [Aegilops tauschii subsp. strangulata]XP_045090540.1 uncharacterized protein LOC120976409 isoform X2 [Aegilops tauschii subsp. strangulata]XP_045090541.1 uncharacterized protein LOC120976409 isoform X2 [Aegilops tauschii subsp. strangulata]XP_045090542.1 uncharacterized protein LOC120976409 isoform X2 [Aegilops tauschii subsp. strangulata]
MWFFFLFVDDVVFAGSVTGGFLGESTPFPAMVCSVCRCLGAPCIPVQAKAVPQVFDVMLDEDCFRRMYIPCHVRASLAAYIQEHRNAGGIQEVSSSQDFLMLEKLTESAFLKMRRMPSNHPNLQGNITSFARTESIEFQLCSICCNSETPLCSHN